jgi:GT2 family glycosyltransferase
LDYPKFNVLVVDNAPSNDLASQIAARWGADYLLEPTVGPSRARNVGTRSCATEIVAYLDDDSVPEREWLARLAVEFEDPLLMVAAGRVLPLGGAAASKDVGPLVSAPDRGPQRRRLDAQTPFWFEMAAFGAIGDSCNMAIRRKAFDLWPGFDERLGRGRLISGSEENHAVATLIEAGYAALYTPQAVVHHHNLLTVQEAKANELRDYRSGAAYATLLLVESRHRWEILRYLVVGQIGRDRGWRGPSKPLTSRLRILLACLPAPFLYLQSCVGHMRSRERDNRARGYGSAVPASKRLPL